jgi:hypothetical protein
MGRRNIADLRGQRAVRGLRGFSDFSRRGEGEGGAARTMPSSALSASTSAVKELSSRLSSAFRASPPAAIASHYPLPSI